MRPPQPAPTLFPYTTLFRSGLKVTVEVPQTKGDETPAKVLVSGIDKHTIGSFCRAIKDARKPEPYKGKRSEEHTSELQSLRHLVCRLLLEKKKKNKKSHE